MALSPNLELPLIQPSQAQKHVTHNEALAVLDAVVQLAVADRDLTEPPGGETEGDRFIVAAGATGAWAGRDGEIALFQDDGWTFLAPLPGWIAWVVDEATLVFWNGAAWVVFTEAVTALQNLALLGIGTTADGTNPFAAKLNKALWTALTTGEGGDGDLRYTLNKEGASSVLSLLMQSNWSGRAELGLIGDDHLTLKVSPDGSAWTTALSFDATYGGMKTVPGSAAAPGLRVGADDTGFYQSAGKLHGARGGAEFMRATATGLALGEGFDPDEALVVRRTGATACRFFVESETSTNQGLTTASSAGPNSAPANSLIRTRGTLAAPESILQNDRFGQIIFRGYSSGELRTAISLVGTVQAATPSATDMESRLTLSLVAPGAGGQSEFMRFEHATGLSMYGANPVVDKDRHHRLRSYTVATLPSASPAGQMIRVSDGFANRQLAVSDGTNWRFPDGDVVS